MPVVTYNPFIRNYDFTLSPNHTHDQYIVDWKESVLSKAVAYGGAVASGTNRYISPTTSGLWIQDNIYEWDGSDWEETTVSGDEGPAVFVEDVEKIYIYHNGVWVLIGTIIDHGNLLGLGDDDHTQYILHDGTRAFTGNVQANASGTLDIGSASLPFKDLYLTGSSLYMDGTKAMYMSGSDVAFGGSIDLASDTYEYKIAGVRALYMDAPDNIGVGDLSLSSLVLGGKDEPNNNIAIGVSAGASITESWRNILIGEYAGTSLITGCSANIMIGSRAGENNTSGDNNVMIGKNAGANNITGSANVFLGHLAGINESGSNRLYIENSNTSTPLIYGEFDNNLVRINGDLDIAGELAVASGIAPASAGDTGTQGEIRWTDDYIYVCVATDTWKRSTISTW